jgi:hypothetical protein
LVLLPPDFALFLLQPALAQLATYIWFPKKKQGLFCLFGASIKAQKYLFPTDKNRPTDNKNIQKNGFSITEKNGF